MSPCPAAFLKGLNDKQREEHYFCQDFIKLKKIPTWKEMAAKGRGALNIGGLSKLDTICLSPLMR